MTSLRAKDLGLQTKPATPAPLVLLVVVLGAAVWFAGVPVFAAYIAVVVGLLAVVVVTSIVLRPIVKRSAQRVQRLRREGADHVVFAAHSDATSIGEILRFRANDGPVEIDGRWTIEGTADSIRIWCGMTEDWILAEIPWSAVRTINLAKDGRTHKADRHRAALTLGVRDRERKATIRLIVIRTGGWLETTAPFGEWVDARDRLRGLRDAAADVLSGSRGRDT
ncbi:hypothetical protein [Agromyces allii]|uniref:DUF2550 family protein n=1 Tax=Agromyces allii TaxID=393607 RepID=A0ABN2QTB2_9MICO|nr:hypothetical protein [Agromyces allii]